MLYNDIGHRMIRPPELSSSHEITREIEGGKKERRQKVENAEVP